MSQRLGPGSALTGRYRLEQLLADYSGARCFRATDEVLNRHVVVDLVDSDDPRCLRLLEAARRAAMTSDERFLQVLDAAGSEDLTYCVREWVRGSRLDRVVAVNGPLSGQQAGWVARELAEAMTVLHGNGLQHGALGLDSVIVTPGGSVKIVGVVTEAVLGARMGAGRDGADLGEPLAADLGTGWEGSAEGDVSDIGRVLYASLVARWPGGPAYGLAAAPSENHRLLSPRQVRAGVPKPLDRICDRVLNQLPRYHESPISTARDLAGALTLAVGRSPFPPERISEQPDPGPPHGTTVVAGRTSTPAEVGDRFPPVPGPSRGSEAPSAAPTTPSPGRVGAPAGGPGTRRRRSSAAWTAGSDLLPGGLRAEAPPAGRGRGRSDASAETAETAYTADTGEPDDPADSHRARGGWAARLLLTLAVLALIGVVAVAVVFARSRLDVTGAQQPGNPTAPRSQSVAGSPSPTPTTSTTIKIATARDFDPESDGGNGEERPQDVRNSYDGDPSTVWQTQSYEQGELRASKPGVGVVYDLGTTRRVSQLTVTFPGAGTAAKVLIPAGDTSQAPGTIKDWSQVASASSARGATTFKPERQVSTRYLLVYLTRLPKDGSVYRGRIAEITVQA